MTADDVVATFERLTGKDSQALSSFGGVLSPGGTTKVDASTVRFSLDAPNGIFPYLLGGMTYQAIVLPKSYQMPADLTKPGEWTAQMNGTGPFKLKENRGQAGLSFVANDDLLGRQAEHRRDRVPDPRGQRAGRRAARRADRPRRADQLRRRAAARQRRAGPADRHGQPPLPQHERHEGAVQGRAGAPGDRAGARPSADRLGPVGQVRADRERQPDVARLRVHGQVRGAAQAGSRQGEVAAQGRQRDQPEADADLLSELRDAGLRPARRVRPEEDRHHLQRQGLHLGAVLQRRLVRGQGQARAVALDRFRHRRLRAPPGSDDVLERGPEVGRRLERRALRQQEVRQDGGRLHRLERPAVAEEVRQGDADTVAQGHPGDLRLLLQLHRRREPEGQGYVPDGIAIVNLRGVTVGWTRRGRAPAAVRGRASVRVVAEIAQFALTSHNDWPSASSRCCC